MTTVAAMVEVAKPGARRFEGFRSRPYLCPAAVASIAYGATRYRDGRRVRLSDPPVSVAEGEALLDHDMTAFTAAAVALSPVLAQLPAEVGAAIGDFCFNLGTTRYKASTLRKRVQARDWTGAAHQLRLWVHAAGRTLPGLVKRRAWEAQLILRAMSAANDNAEQQLILVGEARRILQTSADPIGDLRRLLA
jgi:lysozyme